LARGKAAGAPGRRTAQVKCKVRPKPAALQHQLAAAKLKQEPQQPKEAEHFFLPNKKLLPVKSQQNHQHLLEFNKKYMGLEDYDDTKAQLGELFYNNLTSVCNDVHHRDQPDWKKTLPACLDLLSDGFGQPDLNHSFSQEACFETTVLHTLCSGFLDPTDTLATTEAHPLIGHLASSKVAYTNYDFRWL
jgi:hypothetical protein